MSSIAIIEDDPKIARLLADYLTQAGFDIATAHSGREALTLATSQHFDLFLLDVMLPDGDGFSVCKQLRLSSSAPILFLTARIAEEDRLMGLELGGDDYIVKPFSPREVVARVKANLRRLALDSGQSPTSTLQLDQDTLTAQFRNRSTDLTAIEFALLAALTAAPNRLFNRDELIDRIYSDGRVVSDRTIDSHIKKLRQKLSRINQGEVIEAVYGAGYRFKPCTKLP
ncbi:response regulator [Aequoribacter sp.]|uniref:response regulator n=1 Tax=Aequoribacter sp. TaxID=2847771 RepID=UPI003F6A0F33